MTDVHDRHRHQAGAPASQGGRFAEEIRAEPAGTLTVSTPPQQQIETANQAALREGAVALLELYPDAAYLVLREHDDPEFPWIPDLIRDRHGEAIDTGETLLGMEDDRLAFLWGLPPEPEDIAVVDPSTAETSWVADQSWPSVHWEFAPAGQTHIDILAAARYGTADGRVPSAETSKRMWRAAVDDLGDEF